MSNMPRRHARLAILALMTILVLSALTCYPSSGLAADSIKVGVVDPQAVLERSKAGRRALDGLKEYATTRQKLLASDEDALKDIEKQLKDQESSISFSASSSLAR